jgi:hypothetical protein
MCDTFMLQPCVACMQSGLNKPNFLPARDKGDSDAVKSER